MVGVLIVIGIVVVWKALEMVLEKGIDGLFDGMGWLFRKRKPDDLSGNASAFIRDHDIDHQSAESAGSTSDTGVSLAEALSSEASTVDSDGESRSHNNAPEDRA